MGEKKTPPDTHKVPQRGKRRKTMYSFPSLKYKSNSYHINEVKPVFCRRNDSIFGVRDWPRSGLRIVVYTFRSPDFVRTTGCNIQRSDQQETRQHKISIWHVRLALVFLLYLIVGHSP